jgi:hypothetical protein
MMVTRSALAPVKGPVTTGAARQAANSQAKRSPKTHSQVGATDMRSCAPQTGTAFTHERTSSRPARGIAARASAAAVGLTQDNRPPMLLKEIRQARRPGAGRQSNRLLPERPTQRSRLILAITPSRLTSQCLIAAPTCRTMRPRSTQPTIPWSQNNVLLSALSLPISPGRVHSKNCTG